MPPTTEVNTVIATYQRYVTLYGRTLRKRQLLHQQLYDCTFDVHLDPDHFKTWIRPPTARRLVQNPVNHIAMDTVTVKRTPKASGRGGVETKQSKEQADKVERWCNKLLTDWLQQAPNLLRLQVFNSAKYGECFNKLTWTSDYLDHMGQKKRRPGFEGNPFLLELPPPQAVYSSLNMQYGYSPREAFIENVVTVLQMRELLEALHYPKDAPTILSGYEDDQLVKWVEWWTPESRGYFAGTETGPQWETVPIDQQAVVKNRFGYVPMVRSFSGKGEWPVDGDPGAMAVGLLTGWEERLIGQARIECIMDTIAHKFGIPPLNIEVAAGAEGVPPGTQLDMGPGGVFQLPPGVTAKYFETPKVLDILTVVSASIDRELEAFQPSITTGQGQAGEAAISSTTRLNQANLQWESLYVSAKRALAQSLGLALRCVDTVMKETIELDGVAIGPDDIDGYYIVEVDIKSGNPDSIRWDYLMGKQMKGELDRRTIMEKFYHEDDATQKLADLDAEQLLPQLAPFIVQKAIERVGAKEALAALTNQPPGVQPTPAGGIRPGGPVGPMQMPGVGGSPTRGARALPQQEMTLPGLAEASPMMGR